jgi:redox-sensitive bicupin YhaK (pirin superfamily)
VETVHFAGARALREVAVSEDLIVVLLHGSLEIAEGRRRVVAPCPVAIASAGSDRVVTIENPGPDPARYMEIILQRPPGAAVAMEDLTLVPVPSGPPYLKFLPLASGLGHTGCFQLPCEAAVYLARLRAGESLIFETSAQRRAMILAARGLVQAGRFRLLAGDWLVLQGESEVSLTAVQASWFLLVDLP